MDLYSGPVITLPSIKDGQGIQTRFHLHRSALRLFSNQPGNRNDTLLEIYQCKWSSGTLVSKRDERLKTYAQLGPAVHITAQEHVTNDGATAKRACDYSFTISACFIHTRFSPSSESTSKKDGCFLSILFFTFQSAYDLIHYFQGGISGFLQIIALKPLVI